MTKIDDSGNADPIPSGLVRVDSRNFHGALAIAPGYFGELHQVLAPEDRQVSFYCPAVATAAAPQPRARAPQQSAPPPPPKRAPPATRPKPSISKAELERREMATAELLLDRIIDQREKRLLAKATNKELPMTRSELIQSRPDLTAAQLTSLRDVPTSALAGVLKLIPKTAVGKAPAPTYASAYAADLDREMGMPHRGPAIVHGKGVVTFSAVGKL